MMKLLRDDRWSVSQQKFFSQKRPRYCTRGNTDCKWKLVYTSNSGGWIQTAETLSSSYRSSNALKWFKSDFCKTFSFRILKKFASLANSYSHNCSGKKKPAVRSKDQFRCVSTDHGVYFLLWWNWSHQRLWDETVHCL